MGGCASKPKDSDTRKVPAPALRRPHAPPEIPLDSPKAAPERVAAQEKKDGDENKETALGGVSEPAPEAPKMKEPETTDVKPITEEAAPVEVSPTEAKVEADEPPKAEKKEVAESVVLKEEKEEVAESVVPKKEKKEIAETVLPKEGKKEIAETEAAKEEEKEVTETVVPKEEKKEASENVVPKQEKEEVVENAIPKQEKEEIAENAVPKQGKEEVAENVVPKQEKTEVAAA